MTDHLIPENEYLAMETAHRRHEYVDGVLFPLAESSIRHNLIAQNLARELARNTSSAKFSVFGGEMKVRVPGRTIYYPDVVVNAADYRDTEQIAEIPRVIFEVVSPETERLDVGEKAKNYQSLASLEVYGLVNQFAVAITLHTKSNGVWTRRSYTKKEEVLPLPALSCGILVASIYYRTGF